MKLISVSVLIFQLYFNVVLIYGIDLSTEIQLRTYGCDANDTIKFVLQSDSNPKCLKVGEPCVVYSADTVTSTIEIIGSDSTGNEGFIITHYGVDNGEQTMRLSLNTLKIYENGTYEFSFMYDTRDCNYYSGCPNGFTKDITLAFVKGHLDKLWFYHNGSPPLGTPSSENGWEEVINGSKNCWNVKGYTHCDLNWENLAPTTPQNFYITGSTGQHPTLHWDQNREPDLVGYKIYVSYDNAPYSLLHTINNPSTTSFTDNSVTITSGRFDPTVCYKLSTFDADDLESEKTSPQCVRSNELSKENVSNNDIQFPNEYKLYYAYPSPFNPTTTISYQLPKNGYVVLEIYNVLGTKALTLVNEFKSAGFHSVQFNAGNLPTGMYVYRIHVGNFVDAKKILLIK